jgi:hypothetical protein
MYNILRNPKKGARLGFRILNNLRQPGIILSALLITFIFTITLFMGCSGGGGSSSNDGGEVSALNLPDRITLSSVEESSNSQAALSLRARLGYSPFMRAFDDAGTDYDNQTKDSWIDDTDALDMINDILGVVQDTAYENFVNAGPYKALVRKVDESEQSQGGTSTTSSTTESLMEIIVDVSRSDNDSPMIVKVWVHEEDGPGGFAMLIRGYFTVTAGVSASYPYGRMTAHFKGTALDANGEEVAGDPLFTMAMSVGADNTGNVVIQFVDVGEEEEGGQIFEWDNQARIVAKYDLTEGNAYVYSMETDYDTGDPEEEVFFFAYNEDYFKYQEEGEVDVTVLDKNDLIHKVFRYKLFEADSGDRVTRNSGFPIRLSGGQYAYVGYYGLWAPYGVEIENGDTVTNAETDEEYTVFNVQGKLTEHTQTSILLDDLDGVEFSVWDGTSGKDLVVTWDSTVAKFYKIGERSQETGQITYYDAPYAQYVFNEWDGGWCEALKAWLPLGRTIIEGSSTVYYHTETTVNPQTAENLDLYFWGFALDAPITQGVIDAAAAAEAAYWGGGGPNEKHYTFNAETMLLVDDDDDPVTIGDGLDLDNTTYQWGYNMGPLTTDDAYTAGDCWGIYDESTYYYWASGQNEWNQYTTVKDADGDYEVFDSPLHLSYTHSTDNDINGDSTYDGKKFNLDYDGFELQIPWEFDADEEDWQPAFNLKDGVTMQDADGTEYVVKAVEEALVMAEVSGADPAPELEIEEIDPPTLTYDSSKTDLVGAEPADVELKVIKGELMD